jgi:hypothetical protein
MTKFSSDFLTPAQLVKRWKGTVTTATLSSWRSRNSGPAYIKIGGKVLYRVADVEAYEQTNTKR